MTHAKLTFTTTIVFSGDVEELPTVQSILAMLKNGELDIEYIDAHSTVGNNFVIMVKPKGQEEKSLYPAHPEDIPF